MILDQNLQDSVATANFSFLPKLKVLGIYTSNLTKLTIPPAGVIANLEELRLTSNPLDLDTLTYENFKNLKVLDVRDSEMEMSTIKKFPSTLVELIIYLKKMSSADGFQHLNVSLSGLQRLKELAVIYNIPESKMLDINLEGCPATLSKGIFLFFVVIRFIKSNLPAVKYLNCCWPGL